MATSIYNRKSPTIKRILKEAAELQAHPDARLHAAPLDINLFEWHFTIQGPPSTPYGAGVYHGRIILPATYPLRPPSFRFLTPSGRFEVNREICLSISGHHEETWQPAWGIRTALCALMAFMEGDAKGQLGGMEMSREYREHLAVESQGWKCPACGGRSNAEILKDERAKLSENEISSTGDIGDHSVNVPQELRFKFRDELQSQKPPPELRAADGIDENVAEVLDSTVTENTAQTRSGIQASRHAQNNGDADCSLAESSHSALNNVRHTAGVPKWVDAAIVGILLALGILLVRKIA